MATTDFSISILTDQSPLAAFHAINQVRAWWSEEIEGSTTIVNEVFAYHYKDVHICKLKIAELVPGKKVVWLVLENYFSFTKDTTEWTGTSIEFDITEQDGKTLIRFTHQGLVPAYECFDICTNAWTQYIQQSLFSLITTGKGQPNGTDTPRTADEQRLGSAAD